MDYHDPYFELLRVQADTIDAMEDILNKLKIAHLTTEEMVISMKDDVEESTN